MGRSAFAWSVGTWPAVSPRLSVIWSGASGRPALRLDVWDEAVAGVPCPLERASAKDALRALVPGTMVGVLTDRPVALQGCVRAVLGNTRYRLRSGRDLDTVPRLVMQALGDAGWRPVRILFWSPTFLPILGGAEILGFELARAMQDRGHHVLVVTDARLGSGSPGESSIGDVGVRRFGMTTPLVANDVPLYRRAKSPVDATLRAARWLVAPTEATLRWYRAAIPGIEARSSVILTRCRSRSKRLHPPRAVRRSSPAPDGWNTRRASTWRSALSRDSGIAIRASFGRCR